VPSPGIGASSQRPLYDIREMWEVPHAIIHQKRSAQRVHGLGEIALRVENLDAMQKFYADVIGLPLMTRFQNSAFFKTADGYAGHTQVLALFARAEGPGYRRKDAATSTIDHIAFEIFHADFEGEKKKLEGLGLPVETAEHA
jgi:catechol-2,3-dioxygenase